LGNHKDIREDDSSIDIGGEAVDWLEGKRRCDFGGAAASEEIVVAFGFVVLWMYLLDAIPWGGRGRRRGIEHQEDIYQLQHSVVSYLILSAGMYPIRVL
jgi:nitrate reductase NapE component